MLQKVPFHLHPWVKHLVNEAVILTYCWPLKTRTLFYMLTPTFQGLDQFISLVAFSAYVNVVYMSISLDFACYCSTRLQLHHTMSSSIKWLSSFVFLCWKRNSHLVYVKLMHLRSTKVAKSGYNQLTGGGSPYMWHIGISTLPYLTSLFFLI